MYAIFARSICNFCTDGLKFLQCECAKMSKKMADIVPK